MNVPPNRDTFSPRETSPGFIKNMLRPCPMLENPQLLREMVHKTGAHSTDLQSPESVDHLCDKCITYAENWKPEAERLWKDDKAQKTCGV